MLCVFFEEDIGGDFVMVNVIELCELLICVVGVEVNDMVFDVFGKYMEYMWFVFLCCVCYLVLVGGVVVGVMDFWGFDESVRRWL